MIADLIARLDHGWELCEVATNPKERDRLEDCWIRLLHDYEREVNAEFDAAIMKEVA
ncbi:MAG: hypothetical protein ACR2OE_13665 [Thermomicrobiales bacterium]